MDIKTFINEAIKKLRRCYDIQKKYSIQACPVYWTGEDNDEDYYSNDDMRINLVSLFAYNKKISFIEECDMGIGDWQEYMKWTMFVHMSHIHIFAKKIDEENKKYWTIKNWKIPFDFVNEEELNDLQKNFLEWLKIIATGTIGYNYAPETLLKIEENNNEVVEK